MPHEEVTASPRITVRSRRLGAGCAAAVTIRGPRHSDQECRHNGEISEDPRQIGSGGNALDDSHVEQ